jgi:hypothetical protein
VARASVWTTTRRMPVSGEGIGDQAGPEQEDSCCRECKKAVRDEVPIEHLGLRTCPKRSKSSEKTLSQDMVGVALVRGASARSERLQMHEPGRSQRPSNPSVLLPRRSFQWSFAPPRNATKRRGALHSQKDFVARTEIGDERCFRATGVSIRERSDPPAKGLVNHARGLPISAAIGLRYRGLLAAWVAVSSATGTRPT